MKIAYGYNVVDEDGDLFAMAMEANHYFNEAALFGAWLVDLIPACEFARSSAYMLFLPYACFINQ